MMVFGKIKGALYRAFKGGHPDVYDALKNYCEEHEVNISDVTASAVASYLAADEEGKAELEERMKERRTGRSGSTDIKGTLGIFKEVCSSMGEMFKAMNEARAGMSMESMLSDFKAVSNTLSEMKKAGSEAGTGSTEDLLATLLFTKLFGEKGKAATKTGTGKITKVEE